MIELTKTPHIDNGTVPSINEMQQFVYGRVPRTVVLRGCYVTHCSVTRPVEYIGFADFLNMRHADMADVLLTLKYRDGTMLETKLMCNGLQLVDPDQIPAPTETQGDE